MTRPGLLAIHLACLSLMVFAGLFYDTLSPGLAARGADGPFFCAELLSSGGDDDAMVLAFAVFALPLLLRIIRCNRHVATAEVTFFLCCGGVTVLALWAAGLGCAEVFYTAFVLPDPLLAGALLALPVAALSLLALRIRP